VSFVPLSLASSARLQRPSTIGPALKKTTPSSGLDVEVQPSAS